MGLLDETTDRTEVEVWFVVVINLRLDQRLWVNGYSFFLFLDLYVP